MNKKVKSKCRQVRVSQTEEDVRIRLLTSVFPFGSCPQASIKKKIKNNIIGV